MSNRFKRAVIDDVTSRNIDASLQDHLLDLFESAMKSVATTLVRGLVAGPSDWLQPAVRTAFPAGVGLNGAEAGSRPAAAGEGSTAERRSGAL